MARPTVLVIDDEKDLHELVRYNLEKEGYDVVGAHGGEAGIDLARKLQPAAILLDVMLPGMDGLEVCRRLRGDEKTARIPVIMLTAKAGESDRVVGLELGADDYVTKPFSPRELSARVKAVLRRASVPVDDAAVLASGDLRVDVPRHQVSCAGKDVVLTPAEFRILVHLMRRPGRVVSRGDFIEEVLDRDKAVLDRTIDVHILSLRKKMGRCRTAIETVRGFGYRLSEPPARRKGG